MTLDATMMADDLAYMVADLPTSVTIGTNAACNAVVTDLIDGDTLMLAGVMPDQAISIYVPVSSLTVVPTAECKVISGTTTYRCIKVTTTSDGIAYILDCAQVQA